MFDVIPPGFVEEVQRAARETAAEVIAIKMVLVEKGLATPEELEKWRLYAVSGLDQMITEAKEGGKCSEP